MIIPRNTATMLIEIAPRLRQYGVNIGYISQGIAVLDQSSEYIVRESATEDGEHVIHFLHINDLKIEKQGNIIQHEMLEFPENDQLVEEMLAKINEAILNGEIWFDPGVTREIDGKPITITLKIFPNAKEPWFDIPVLNNKTGYLYSHSQVIEKAKTDPFFTAALEIIKDVWPDIMEARDSEQPPNDNLWDSLKKFFT